MFIKILLILLLNQSLSFSFFNKDQFFVVVTHNAPIYNNFIDSHVKTRVSLGTLLENQSRRGTRVQFEYNGEQVWIDQKHIDVLDFKEKDFVNFPVLFSEISIMDEDQINFIYDNKLYEINIDNVSNIKPKFLANIPSFSQISASPDKETFLLTGDSVSNEQSILKLALYNINKKEFTPLSYFLGDDTTIENSEFSPDGKYLNLCFSINDEKYTHMYDITTKKLLLAKKGINNIAWFDTTFLIFSDTKIEYVDSLQNFIPNLLYTVKKNESDNVSGATIGNQYFIEIGDKIFHFQDSKLNETEFRSLDRSPSGDIEHYERKKQSITLYKGKRLRSLSGEKPPWTFLSILDDRTILYRKRKDVLQILSLYDAIEDKSSSYKWVEEPYHTFKNGISVEFAKEDDEIWLFIEKPEDFVKIVQIPKMLK